MRVSPKAKQRIDRTCAKLDAMLAFCFKKTKEDAAKKVGWSILFVMLCGVAWAVSLVFPGTRHYAATLWHQAFPLSFNGNKPVPEVPAGPPVIRPIVPKMTVQPDYGPNYFRDYRTDRTKEAKFKVNPPELAVAASAVATSAGKGTHPAVSWKGRPDGGAQLSFATDPPISVVKLQVSARSGGRSFGVPVDVGVHDEYSVAWMRCYTASCELPPDKTCTGTFDQINEGEMLQAPNEMDGMPIWFFYFLAQMRLQSVVRVVLDDGIVVILDVPQQTMRVTVAGTRLRTIEGSEEFSLRRLGGIGEQSFFIGKDANSLVIGAMIEGPHQILARYQLPNRYTAKSRSTVSIGAVRGDFSLAGVAFSGFPTYLGKQAIPDAS